MDVDNSTEDRLRRIQAVTDTALSYLDVEEFLNELLDRVLEILEADTAAVLLADESSNELFARVARGIEEEVRQGVRIPIGRGFAGRIASERRPVVLDRVDETTVANPILWQKGIRAMLGVPLLTGGAVIGVLHVGTLGERRFTAHDVELLELAAERIASALLVRLLEAERDAAVALQRSLLPSALPRLAGLEFAARYVPAQRGGIGGDWYDVFRLDSGDVWIVTGDVAGHGLRAAVVMGRVRSALRSYALLGRAPEDVLALTDHKMQHFEVGQMATIAMAVLSPPYAEARVVLAGHPPPVMAAPGREAFVVDASPGPPLGVGLSPQPPPTVVDVPPGAVLFFYTDGLIERRGESLVDGVARLCDALIADAPELVCQRVMGALVGQWEPEDDIAVLAVRRSAEPGT
jgi:serine phosphatase RsbU (regulator of sigma subunit)